MSELNKAILATTKQVGTLGKAAMNPHGGYKYVSIDKFYETVAVAAANNGLNWSLREVAFDLLPNLGKTGAIRVTYAVDLMHESGVTEKDFSQVSIIHPVQGAQTVGSAMSYADKVVMRQLFKVPTGEKDIDADETDNRSLDTRPDQSARKPAADLDLDPSPVANDDVSPERQKLRKELAEACQEGAESVIEACLKLAVDLSEGREQLMWTWSDAITAIEWLKQNSPDTHTRVVAMFTKRKTELKGK